MPKSTLPESIESRIFVIRGQKVMLDRDLADLYSVQAGALNRAVKRNAPRFPEDFMFQITRLERDHLKCQFGISSWGGDRGLPYAFTEQGVAMLSSVLRSERAVRVNIEIMRTFVRLKRALALDADLARKIEDLEKKCIARHRSVLKEIGKLLLPEPEGPPPKIRLVK